ncbi:monovalent cation/H+ antiporter complex subunit F [Xinfangfangia sp. CPCC 101601]|uniref:Monovalent cation/H+ antiporter complex subunit F n=1 Tax=Pseudogemmobacter lacusdianii TaxID=3069608 RepID=A0ABU0VYK9_9RHOB|nr:monovalent cation/H+ antiporter complex subunit F [Xinfangfangia sp. CPCC 101601]MDQ2065985.1 monovalent cation/H+ antiporter complex subunit F [Xinfangfangia sp. CPCC 101601]
MLGYALSFAIGCFGLALLLNLLRLFTIKNLVDRVLVVDTMAVNVAALVILAAAQSGSALSFEAAVLIAMTGFVSTMAFCKYLLRGSIIE